MPIFSLIRIPPTLCLVLLLLTVTAGCQQRVASKLQGRWEGHPDSAAARAEREAEKYGDESVEPAEEGSATKTSESTPVTDWEKFDVTVFLDFVSSERLEMSLSDDQQTNSSTAKSGSWQIISTSPSGCTIELQTESDNTGGEAPTLERRRFELLLDERDGTCVGFQLTEVGADRQLGALYFQRPAESATQSD